jgi:hypothetical protein
MRRVVGLVLLLAALSSAPAAGAGTKQPLELGIQDDAPRPVGRERGEGGARNANPAPLRENPRREPAETEGSSA